MSVKSPVEIEASGERREITPSAATPCSVYGVIDPDYARVFTHARIIAWQFGYACLAHGSFTRDLDLLLVPWTENACAPIDGIVRRIADVAGLTLQGEPSNKPHGRKAWTLLFPAFNDPRWVDVSAFTPNYKLRHSAPAETEGMKP